MEGREVERESERVEERGIEIEMETDLGEIITTYSPGIKWDFIPPK